MTRLSFLMLLLIPVTQPLRATAQVPNSSSWKLEEVEKLLMLYPRDAYLRYATLQLARVRGHEELQRVSNIQRRDAGYTVVTPSATDRHNKIDLFSISSGSLAIQESLQLDAMIVNSHVTAEPAKIELSTLMPAQ